MTKPPEQQTPPPHRQAAPTPAEDAENDLRWWEKSRVSAVLDRSTLEGFEPTASTAAFLVTRCRADIPPRPAKAADDD